MHSPYGLEVSDSCLNCKLRSEGYFCDFDAELVRSFETLKYQTIFPKGAVLFVEGQSPRGVFMLCSGRVKLSTCSSDGKSLITRIAESGEVLGLGSSVSGKPYMATAETLSPCQVNFIKREAFLRFLKDTYQDALKGLMAGAKVTMMASELLQNGINRIGEVLDEMKRWMEEHEYSSVTQMIGSMSQLHVVEPAAFERANYMKMLASYRPLS